MSTIKSSDEHLTLNADGTSKDIKFQANGVEKASISSAGAFTSTTIDATKLTGALPAIDGSSLTGISVNAVTGNLTVSGDITGGNNGSIFLLDNAGQKAGEIQTDSSAANALQIDADPDNTNADSYTAFRIDNSEKFRITADGRGLSQFTAKAWVRVDMSTMGAPDSHNISSITDVATGHARCNFSNAMANSSYNISTSAVAGYIAGHSNINTTSFYLRAGDSNWSQADPDYCMALVFGD